MKILDRYLFSEVAGPFVFGMIGLVVIGMVDIVFTLIDMFINNGIPFLIVMKLLIYKVPAIMVLFYPMAVLFATLIVIIRLAKDSEITVMRTGGLSLGRIVAPIIVTGFLIFGLSFFTNELLVPWANKVSDKLIEHAVLKKPSPDILENTFFKESNERYFYVGKIFPDNKMENIVMYEIAGDFPRVVTAKKASWDGRVWVLEQGVIHKYSANGIIKYQGTFDNMTLFVDNEFYNYYRNQNTPRQMSSKELKERINKLDAGGVSTETLKVEYYMKYATPMACFIFSLTGVALSLLFIRNGKDLWGIVAAVLSALLSVGFYFFVTAVFRSLGRGALISPVLAAWAPNIIFAIIAVLLIHYRTKTE